MKKIKHVMVFILSITFFLVGCQKEQKKDDAAEIPNVKTIAISEITTTTALGGGEIIDDGGASVTLCGLVWDVTENPTIDSNLGITENSIVLGSYTAELTDLLPNTTYYVRAYAVNSEGTAYGNLQIFKTEEEPMKTPNVKTTTISKIAPTTARGGGEVIDDGGAPVTLRGLVWSVTKNPTVDSNTGITENGAGLGSYMVDLTDLLPNTTYYVRAYAINSEGITYGDQQVFKTKEDPLKVPTVITAAISKITAITALGGGEVVDDGGAPITLHGLVWSVTENPTVDSNVGITENSIGLGSYTTELTDLLPNTTYYVRAYAINSVGAAYGNQESFNTQSGIPSFSELQVNDIHDMRATIIGTVLTDGGFDVLEKGIVWSDKSNPTIETNTSIERIEEAGTGNIEIPIRNLSISTIYYVKMYVRNSQGINYGAETQFKTKEFQAKFTDKRDGSVYKAVLIGKQVWMAENLKYLPKVNGSGSGSRTKPYYYVYGYKGTNPEEAKATENYKTYGVLYNWAATMTSNTSKNTNSSNMQGICPDGWHLPSDSEWEALENYLIANNYNYDGTITGNKIAIAVAEQGLWRSNSGTGIIGNSANYSEYQNKSGFSAPPGGYRYNKGNFIDIARSGYWWSSTEHNTNNAFYRYLFYGFNNLGRSDSNKEYGFSVRCVRD